MSRVPCVHEKRVQSHFLPSMTSPSQPRPLFRLIKVSHLHNVQTNPHPRCPPPPAAPPSCHRFLGGPEVHTRCWPACPRRHSLSLPGRHARLAFQRRLPETRRSFTSPFICLPLCFYPSGSCSSFFPRGCHHVPASDPFSELPTPSDPSAQRHTRRRCVSNVAPARSPDPAAAFPPDGSVPRPRAASALPQFAQALALGPPPSLRRHCSPLRRPAPGAPRALPRPSSAAPRGSELSRYHVRLGAPSPEPPVGASVGRGVG